MSSETEPEQNEGNEPTMKHSLCRIAGNILAGGLGGYTVGGLIAVFSVNRGMPERHLIQLGIVGAGMAVGAFLPEILRFMRKK